MDARTALLVAAVIVAALAIAGWWRTRAERERVTAERDRLAGDQERLAAQVAAARDDERHTRRELEGALALERRARRAERGWAQELRSQVLALHQQRSIFSGTHDTTELVLHVALELLEAERGLLLSRRDGDGDGRLDLVCHEGFAHDPSDSAIAQHFARRVIGRGETVRENDGGLLAEHDRTPADDEIHCLVAIPIYLRDDFSGVVICADSPGGFESYEDDVLLALGDHAGSVLHNSRLRGELRSSYLATVGLLADAIATKDPFVGGHSEEVAAYVGAVAGELEVEPRRREELVFGSLLHDLGKIGISERILLKPARLTPEERAVVELHPRIGYRLVSRLPALDGLAAAVLHHHEHWDGGGYPAGLRGEQIPIEARIIGVADAFSAMTSDRPYSKRRTIDEACAELERCAGTQFDPQVVRSFVAAVRADPPKPGRGRLGDAHDEPELEVLTAGGPLLGSGTMAIIDNLTLLYSHRYLHESAAAAEVRAGVQGRPFAVVMAQLAGLPAVNARDGYAQGDEMIRMAARVMQDAALACGGTACRHGGPRLALLVPDTEPDAVEALAAQLADDLPAEGMAKLAVAVWQPGETGAEVVERAHTVLRGAADGAARSVPSRW